MAQNFTELIYKSADATVGIASGGADRLLGIKPDGSAVVVEIGGNSAVLTKASLRPSTDNPSADDLVVYSKKGADDLFFLKDNVEATSTASAESDSKVYSCKAVRALINGQADGSKWEEVSGASPAVIRPKSGKGVVIGGVNGATAPLTVNGEASISGNATINGTSSLKGNTTIGTSGGQSATLTVTGASTLNGAATIGSTLSVSGASTLSGNTTVGASGSTATLTINGTCTATEFYESSDANLKTNISDIREFKKNAIKEIKFVEFDWKDGIGHSYGVIAQDVNDKLPELVQTTESGTLQVNYTALLCAKVALLEEQVKQLKFQINGGNKDIG